MPGYSESRGVQSYVRFHKTIDEALQRAVVSVGMKRATLVAWIIETYLSQHWDQIIHDADAMEKYCSEVLSSTPAGEDAAARWARESDPYRMLQLDAAASVYDLKIGRSTGHAPSVRGKPILLTLSREANLQLQILSALYEITPGHLRSAIVATFLIKQGVLT